MENYNQIDFTKLKVGNYNRKSSESEDKQMLSIGSQKDEAKRIADFYKLPKFVEVFEESKSAKTEGVRPEFSRMMLMVKRGEINSIVCWKADRLARNMTEGGQIIDLLSSGVLKAIITHDKVFYPWDNVIVLSVEFSQGKQFVKELSVNVKRGLKKKAEAGIPSGVASLGFINDKTEEKGNRKWLVDEMKLKAIKILFDMFLTGTYSAGKLHRFALKELKLTTVKRKRIGGAFITLSRIYEILKDPIYAGFFFQGGERYELDISLPRLITEDEHNKVKTLLAKKNIPKAQHNEATFAGFIQSDKGDFMGQDVKYQLICDCKKNFVI
jgi:DNA invertase Pin-like site-specific DNA recombinase